MGITMRRITKAEEMKETRARASVGIRGIMVSNSKVLVDRSESVRERRMRCERDRQKPEKIVRRRGKWRGLEET